MRILGVILPFGLIKYKKTGYSHGKRKAANTVGKRLHR